MRSWDPAKGEFSTYYYKAAENPFKWVIFKTQSRQHNGWHTSLNRNKYFGEDEDELIDCVTESSVVEEEVEAMVMAEKLHKAIARLPRHLRRHAEDTLEGRVTWSNTKETVETRNEMLKALRIDLGDHSV
jgi:hypothetical protein